MQKNERHFSAWGGYKAAHVLFLAIQVLNLVCNLSTKSAFLLKSKLGFMHDQALMDYASIILRIIGSEKN